MRNKRRLLQLTTRRTLLRVLGERQQNIKGKDLIDALKNRIKLMSNLRKIIREF